MLPGKAWRGPRDEMVYVLIGEQAVQHHDEGVQAHHLQTEYIHTLSLRMVLAKNKKKNKINALYVVFVLPSFQGCLIYVKALC